MKISDIDVLTLKNVDDAELLSLHKTFHQTFGAISMQTKELQKGFKALTVEMGCRGLSFNPLKKADKIEVEVQSDEQEPSDESAEEKAETIFETDIIKVDDEKRLVTGIVLEPEVWDNQKQIYSAAVIEKTAHKFLAMYNRATGPGVMHKDYTKSIDIVESYITPKAATIGTQKVKKGTWMMTMRIGDDDIWQQIKDGELTGFSIKGMALAQMAGGDMV